MADIFDYISRRGDLTFEQDGFNELDALVLSRLSYLPFDGAVSSCLFDETVSYTHLTLPTILRV